MGLSDLYSLYGGDGWSMGGVPDSFYTLGVDPIDFNYVDPGVMELAAGSSFSDPEWSSTDFMRETMPGGAQEGQSFDLGGGGGRFDISGGEVRPLGEATPGSEHFPGFDRNLGLVAVESK